MLVIDIPHAVLEDFGITVTVFVVLGDEVLQVLVPTFRGKLLRLEEVTELSGFVRFLESSFREESSFQLLIGQLAVSVDDDVADFHLLFLVDIDVEDNRVLVGYIIALADIYLGILITLVVEVFLGKCLGTVEHVRSNLSALDKAKFLLHILAFALLQTDIVDVRYTRTNLQIDMQVDLVSNDRVGCYRHIGKQSMLPVALNRFRNLIARECYFLSNGKS